LRLTQATHARINQLFHPPLFGDLAPVRRAAGKREHAPALHAGSGYGLAPILYLLATKKPRHLLGLVALLGHVAEFSVNRL
jgi:hypothetical protein